MIVNKVERKTKKELIVLDFDHTIYHNPKHNFSIDIKPHNIIEARYFFGEYVKPIGIFNHRNICFMLITGRDREQREIILHHLRLNGYRIDNAIFINIYNAYFPDSIQYFDDNSFLIYYWYWKVQIINELRLSNEYKSISVIDNDDSICTMLKKLDINVVKAKIVPLNSRLKLYFNSERNSINFIKNYL